MRRVQVLRHQAYDGVVQPAGPINDTAALHQHYGSINCIIFMPTPYDHT